MIKWIKYKDVLMTEQDALKLGWKPEKKAEKKKIEDKSEKIDIKDKSKK